MTAPDLAADPPPPAHADWQDDILPGFERQLLALPGGETAVLVRRRSAASPAESRGSAGPPARSNNPVDDAVRATLTAAAPAAPKPSGHLADGPPAAAQSGAHPDKGVPAVGQASAKPAVLYLHGFVDYFFQTHLADAFEARGYRFYALDLRGYGRSLEYSTDPERPNYVPDLSVYAQDLDAAARAIAEEEAGRSLVGIGHSTGGLILPLWAAARPRPLRALALNSPWLDFNGNWFMRGPATWLVAGLAKIAPKLPISGLKVHYGRALHHETGGEWVYDLAWKPHDGFPVRPLWFTSVRRWQARVARGIEVGCPVLVMTSLRRGDPTRHHPEVITTDSILNPRQMWRRAPKLGLDVEVRALEGGAHDLALSPEPARSRYLAETLDWFDRVVAPAPRGL
ncbi:MAG: alpha/beta hydrolase [Bifidobacteriaceae bacterium]|nr:alpha/beta hydrolase [Bifidobacteriaceae bacterium]